jgi:hypothetical protein
MTQHYATCLQTIPGRDIKPKPGRNLAHLPFYRELLADVAEYDALRKEGNLTAARALKAAGMARIDAWYEDQEARYDLEVLEQEQLTADRAMAGAMALDIDPVAGF